MALDEAAPILGLAAISRGRLGEIEIGSGTGGLGGRSGGNGKKDGRKPPALMGEEQEEKTEQKPPKISSVLTEGEEAYLKEKTFPRQRPPKDITVVELLEAATVLAKCIRANGSAHCGTELRDYHGLKQELEDTIGVLADSLTSYKGKALRRIKRALGNMAMHEQFLRKALMRIDSFGHDSEAARGREHELLMGLKADIERRAKEIENFLLPRAIKSLLDKAAVSVLTLSFVGEIASYWAQLTSSFWVNFAAFGASALSIAYILGGYALDVIKSSRLNKLAKSHAKKVEQIHEQCDMAARKLAARLALELLREFDDHYARDVCRQRKAVVDWVREKTGVELHLGKKNGSEVFAPDDILAERLAEALLPPS